MYGVRSPHLAADVYRLANRSSVSTEFSETASFVSTAPSTASSVVGDFYVLCLHDFEPTDEDQLGFQKGDILAILKVEDTGWWAAAQGSTIGWVPRAFVEPISDAMAETLKTVQRDQRSARSSTPDAWDSASNLGQLDNGYASSSAEPGPHSSEPWAQRRGSGTSLRTHSSEDYPIPQRHHEGHRPRPLVLHPNGTGGYYTEYADHRTHGHSSSVGSVPFRGPGSTSSAAGPSRWTPDFSYPHSPSEGSRGTGGRRASRDDDALAYQNAKLAAAALPPHLKPEYGEGYLRLDSDGVVKSGTLEALVERLTVDPLKRSQETAYRTTFLMTYRTFTDASTVFELLTERYLMDHPSSLNEEEFAEWKEKRLRPAQTRVLTTLTEWVERYRLVKDENHLVHKLKEFLRLITTPPKNALTAKQLLQTIEKQEVAMAASASSPAEGPSTPSGPGPASLAPKRSLKLPLSSSSGKSKSSKNELLKLDPLELAQHLTLVEYRLYAKVRPWECMFWPKQQRGPEVENLLRFCATSDRLVSWVKYSVLKEDGLGKRADVIDFWIKVAEKCHSLNNVSSLSALVAALASAVCGRLSLTWAHVSRGSHFERLARLTDPTNNFAAYRKFYGEVATSCVPYIGMYLTQLVHYADQYKETVQVAIPPLTPSSVTPPPPFGVPSSPTTSATNSSRSQSSYHHQSVPTMNHINFTRLFKCAEVIHQMLRHQVKGYRLTNPSAAAPHPVPDPSQVPGINLGAENAQLMAYVETMLSTGGVGPNPPADLPLAIPGESRNGTAAVGVQEAWYWQRSAELQTIEAETSDIRKGLEAAGF